MQKTAQKTQTAQKTAQKTMTRRAGIYVRISQDRDGTSDSPVRQADDCKALCERNGWEVVEVYEDRDISAYSNKIRPGYRELISDLAAGHILSLIHI